MSSSRRRSATANPQEVLRVVRAAFEHDPRINLHTHPIEMAYQDEVLTLEGEVANVAAKKRAMSAAIAVPGVRGIVDRLRVAPATRMGDGAVLDAVRDALLEEEALRDCALTVVRKGSRELARAGATPMSGSIMVSVSDGVVWLDDHVTSVGQKQLAGVLAWWVPGSRDVVNGMAVEPAAELSDRELAKMVRYVLEKDRLIKTEAVRVDARDAVVTLEGDVPTDAQREMAECDAWYVFGVDRVVNRLEVRS